MATTEVSTLVLTGLLTLVFGPLAPDLPKPVGAAIRSVSTIIVLDSQGVELATRDWVLGVLRGSGYQLARGFRWHERDNSLPG
jgi:hypothetical protein